MKKYGKMLRHIEELHNTINIINKNIVDILKKVSN